MNWTCWFVEESKGKFCVSVEGGGLFCGMGLPVILAGPVTPVLGAACIEINGGICQEGARVDQVNLYLYGAGLKTAADVDGSDSAGAYKGVRVLAGETDPAPQETDSS